MSFKEVKKEEPLSPMKAAMESSFYSTSVIKGSELDNGKYAEKYQKEQEKRGNIVKKLKITNILELSQRDQEVLLQIKKFMKK